MKRIEKTAKVRVLLAALLLLAGVAAASWVFRGELARRFAGAKRNPPPIAQSPATFGQGSQRGSAIVPDWTPTTNPMAVAVGAVLTPSSKPSEATATSSEYPQYAVMAALLVKFAKDYVKWPGPAFPAADSPLRIGILGDDSFGGLLEEMCQGVECGSEKRKIVVVRSHKVQELKTCQMVFVSKSERDHVPQDLDALNGSVLTVGETWGFLAQGGIIDFYTVHDRVRFEINNYAAIRHEITISRDLIAMSRPRP